MNLFSLFKKKRQFPHDLVLERFHPHCYTICLGEYDNKFGSPAFILSSNNRSDLNEYFPASGLLFYSLDKAWEKEITGSLKEFLLTFRPTAIKASLIYKQELKLNKKLNAIDSDYRSLKIREEDYRRESEYLKETCQRLEAQLQKYVKLKQDFYSLIVSERRLFAQPFELEHDEFVSQKIDDYKDEPRDILNLIESYKELKKLQKYE